MLATPRATVAATDPDATRLNRTTAQLVAEAAEARRLELARAHEKACSIIASITKVEPKHANQFFLDIVRKNPANPQQMEGSCMFCGKPVASTGATKLVDHLVR